MTNMFALQWKPKRYHDATFVEIGVAITTISIVITNGISYQIKKASHLPFTSKLRDLLHAVEQVFLFINQSARMLWNLDRGQEAEGKTLSAHQWISARKM